MSTVGSLPIGRRSFLVRAGHGVLGVAVLGLAGCTADGERIGSGGSAPTRSFPAPSGSSTSPSGSRAGTVGLTWARVDLGFVSAYVLVRGAEATIVDTGVGGSADQIGVVLDEAGAGWAGVRHVVITHKHPDHVGSLSEITGRASRAVVYAGGPDLDSVHSPRRLQPVADGDEVFGLQVIGSPGHTAGHVAVFDPDSAVLVAGDALTNTDGLAGSNPQFTEDEAAAASSVRKLAGLEPRVILVGHGPPVARRAAAELRRLANSIT